MIPYHKAVQIYLPYFTAVAIKSALNPLALLKLSYDITNGNSKLLKQNNFFGIKPKNGKDYNQYKTPFDGINAGLDLIKNHPDFEKQKIGTLKANETMQHIRLKQMLNL